jgi:Protein of unknown function (DUF4238)
MEAVIEGRRPVPDSSAKRHHLVSRFLLRGFVHHRPDRLFQLHVRTGKPNRITVDGAASRRRFYAVTEDDGTVHNRVEAYLALVETHAAPALRQLLDDPSLLGRTERATLSFFFALLDGRTLGGIERTSKSSDQVMRLLLATSFGDPEAFAKTYKNAIGDGSSEDVEALRARCLEGLKDGSIAFPDLRSVALQMTLKSAADVAQLIYQMEWVLLRAVDSEFVTSDRGLAMVDPTPRWPWSGAAWLSSPNVQTTIPLSSSSCLLLLPKHGPTERTEEAEVGKGEVSDANLRTYGWASDYIYGSSQAVVADIRRAAKGRRLPRPQTPKQILLIDAEAGDNRLANEHRRRGWPPQLQVDGKPQDYVVLDPDSNPVETSVDVTHLSKERAMRRLVE